MKVLLIDVNCKKSSTGKIVYDLYSHLNAQGDEAAICYGRGEKITEKNIFKFGIDFETILHAFLTRITGYTGCFSFFSTYRLLKFIKIFKPDVVHIHELHAYFVNLRPLLRYLKANNIKTVMTLHCEFDYTGKCGHSLECNKWQTQCGPCPHLRDYPSVLLFDHTKKMFEQKKKMFTSFETLQLSAPSRWLAERTRFSFLKKYPISIIPNGIDTNTFCPTNSTVLREKLNIHENKKVFLALAPNLMSQGKGGKFILQLAQVLQNEKVVFILIGVDGPLVTDFENVIAFGRIYDKASLAQYYSLADAFIICSEIENYPTTCLEAQSCGTPVYGFDSGGTIETSLLDIDRHFVKKGDVKALADLLKRAPKKTAQMVEKLRKLAVSEFGRDVSLKRYKELYLK